MKTKLKLLVPTIAVLTLSAAALSASAATMRTDLLGESAQASAAVRTLVIDGNTKYVNVKHGEVIRFVANGREFVWNFDGVATPMPFDLSQIAPAGALDHSVTVYVGLGDEDVSFG
jgi:Heavy-metal resistance protein CzcE